MAGHNNSLTIRDHAMTGFQATLKVVPVIGAPLEQLIFGTISEMRMKRVESTLQEIGEILKNKDGKSAIENNEDFANLLEDVTPSLSRATNEDRRKRFRDLLYNATQIASGDAEWERVRLASRLLDEIDAPGLAILVGLIECDVEDDYCCIVRSPNCRVARQSLLEDYKPAHPEHEDGPFYDLTYDWIVIQEWAKKLISMGIIEAEREHGIDSSFVRVQLSRLGELLLDWVLSDIEDSQDPNEASPSTANDA